MAAIAMPSVFPSSFSLYDEENSFQQECLDMSPSLGQPVSVPDFESLAYSAAFPNMPYTAPMMMQQQQSPAPISIYTNNLDNFSNSSLASVSSASVSSAYYSDLGFGPCSVDPQWPHVDDGYVSGGTSPVTQTMPQDAFYAIPEQLVLLDGASLAGLDIGEPSSLLNDQAAAAAAAVAAASMAPATAEQLQYAMFDPTSSSPAMSVAGLGMIDPLAENYISSSAESSPILAARSKSTGSRSPSPSHQSCYSTFDKGALMKCPHKGCTKAFGRVYNLKTHLKSHVSTKPWECPMCPRSFTRKHDLQRHVRVHTGQKPYVCPCCHKRFARTDALTRHIRVEDSCRLSEEVANYKGRRRYSDLS